MTEFIYYNNSPRSIPFTAEQLEDIRHQYVDLGRSAKSIGEQYGVDAMVIFRRLKSLGAKIHAKGRPMISESIIDHAAKLRGIGKPWAYVEAVTGLRESSLQRRIKRKVA